MEKNIKNIKKQFATNGIFYTPKEDAKKLMKFIDISYSEVYDPTCGQGNLLSVFADDVKKYGQELDCSELEKAKQLLTNFEGYAGNTLEDDKFKDKKFDLIMANPPFSIKWEQNPNDERFNKCDLAPKSKADWAFNLHIIHHLKENGQAIVLNFPGTAYRGNSEQRIRKWFVDNNLIDKVISYPPNTFVDTKISTIVYIFKKNKITTDIEFVNDNGISRIVSQKEIEDNNYNLSVNTYIEVADVKETIDIDVVNKQIADLLLSRIKSHLMMEEIEKSVGDIKISYFKEELKKIVSSL